MICPTCHYRIRGDRASHMVVRHGWAKPGSVFSEVEMAPDADGTLTGWCSTCGDPASDDAFVAIIEGRTPEPCDYCGRVLVRIANDD